MNYAQLFFALFNAGVIYFVYQLRQSYEEELARVPVGTGNKTVLIEPLLFPVTFILLILMIHLSDLWGIKETLLARCVLVMVNISIYYFFVLLLLPFLRKYISARACANLWLIPASLYFVLSGLHYFYSGAKPLVILTFPHLWISTVFWVWFLGFIGILLWKSFSHLLYRTYLLQDAKECTQKSILNLWIDQSRRHGVKTNIPILISDKINTPMTLGCFDSTMVLLLPEKHYSEEEFLLIFLHELRHILRVDTRTKLLMDLFTALFWFNPLAWIARRKAADDLELSCDEAVLAGSNEQKRKLYAELLLKNAGNSRGYSTRLSGAAGTLRYRLKHILEPRKRFPGGMVLSLAVFLLVMSIYSVVFADSRSTVKEEIFSQIPKNYELFMISSNRWEEQGKDIYGWKQLALHEYLGSLGVKKIYSGAYGSSDGPHFSLHYSDPSKEGGSGYLSLSFSHDSVVGDFAFKKERDQFYVLEDKIDWDYVRSLLDFQAENPDPLPLEPELKLLVDHPKLKSDPLFTSKKIVSINGEKTSYSRDQGTSAIRGFDIAHVDLSFSYPPEGTYRVKVENWDRSKYYWVISDKINNHRLELAPYSAHYTVYANFMSYRETLYEMEFSFDVELPKETESQ